MREAARALDDVSDHLGEVLRRADELLVEWSKFGAQVRGQVEREAAAVGQIVDGAVGRVAAQGIDRAIGERLRALTLEIERLEQRTRAASRAVVEQRDSDRRLLWGVIAGIVLANALLVVLLLRKPDAPPVAEPIRLDAPSAVAPAPGAAPAVTPSAPTAEAPAETGSGAAPSAAANGSGATGKVDATTGAAQQTSAQKATQAAPSNNGPAPQSGAQPANTKAAAGSGAHGADPAATKASPIALPPPKAGLGHPHKKLP